MPAFGCAGALASMLLGNGDGNDGRHALSQRTPAPSPYPDIGDYALLGDGRNAALVSRAGSIDWCCMPRLDADSFFGRLLDWQHGGYCAIAPVLPWRAQRRYEPDSLVLTTRFETAQGCVEVCDFLRLSEPGRRLIRHELVRVVTGIEGCVELEVAVEPRFEYGETIPYITPLAHAGHGIQRFRATGSDTTLLVSAPHGLSVQAHRSLCGKIKMHAGRRWFLSIRLIEPEPGAADTEAVDLDAAQRALERNRHRWRRWLQSIPPPYRDDAQTLRSALVLKGLIYEDTGAMAGAATTSLPERMGGARNWDYRFCWIRDSVYAVEALHRLGLTDEAGRLRRFITRATAGSAEQMQILYAVSGKRRLTEIELEHLEGYRGSRPVRIGNAAASQHQWDVYGELLQLAWLTVQHQADTGADYWPFLEDVLNHVCDHWTEPDRGIWEMRGQARHFVHSKACCWSALNVGIALAQRLGKKAPVGRWRKHRTAIRRAIDEHGYDARRGVFRQVFDQPQLDAALLRLPKLGYIPYRSPAMLRTSDAIRDTLDHGGLLKRYDIADGLEGGEGVFLPCTFWLVVCLAGQGRRALAWDYYRRAVACANDLGLFAEQYDVESGKMLGNFPQVLTHVSQITAFLTLNEPGAR